MRLVTKFVGLPWSVKRTLFQVGFLLIVTRMALAVLPYRSVRAWFDRWGSTVVRLGSDEYEQLLTWAGSGLGRFVLGDKPCLTQALVVQGLLRRAGLDVDLRIGVARESDGAIRAHAWLDRSGRVILGGRRAERYFATMSPLTPPSDGPDGAMGSGKLLADQPPE